MKGLVIDRERALRVAATCGLGLIAITVLPGLLRPPEPPPLPDDVGFRRSETDPGAFRAPFPPVPGGGRKPGRDRGAGADLNRPGGRERRRHRRDRPEAGGSRDGGPARPETTAVAAGGQASRPSQPSGPASAARPGAAAEPRAPAADAAPPPATVPAPPPAAPAPPAPGSRGSPGPSPPGDGSEEFAPR